MPRTLETIVELNQVMGALREAKSRLDDVPDSMKELHQQYLEHKEKIDQLENAATDAEQERRAAEGEAAECQTKIDHFQGQISKVTTQREYGALLSEIDTAKETQRGLEEKALAALEASEAARSERESLVKEFESINERYEQELAQWEADKPEVATEIDRLEAQIEILRARLSPGPLKQFERLYERHNGEPMAVIQVKEKLGKSPGKLYSCSHCNYEVRPQVVVEIRNTGNLLQCERCYRIFYLDEEG